MKNKLLVFFICILYSLNSFSSHFMGGEITWECLKAGPNAGQYIFEMKVYRDCGGITFSQISQTLTAHNYPTPGATTPILLNFIAIQDISPTGSVASGNACFDCATQPFGTTGAVEEYIWRSDPTTMMGTPPAEGWHFTWGSCCRSSNISNGMADDSWTLRAVMYPYTDPVTGLPVPADPCFDSSPEFKELARTIICTGYEFAYSHNASDDELDEITYSWGEPLGDALAYNPSNPSATALVFSGGTPPYTVNSPIPGNPTLDASTGEISYNSTISGVFVTCIKVEAKKCGQVVAEIFREVQVVLVDCSIYNQPSDGFNDPPVISEAFTDPITGLPSYETTVYAGDFVSFTIDAEDFDTYPGGVLQELTLDASGGQFASDYVTVNNCENPPCATFNNGAGVTPPFTGIGLVSGLFEWQTDCAHMTADVGCNVTSNVFTFLIKAVDDYCPANGISIATIKITVVPPIPDLRCVSVEDNGDVELTWKFVSGAPPTAEPYMVYHSSSPNGPFSLLDSVYYPETTYTHIGANGHLSSQYYFLSTEEGCGVLAGTLESDTLQSIYMNVTPVNLGVSAYLNWNAIHDPPLPSTFLDYNLYLKNPNSAWTNILTTPLLTYQQDAEYCDYYPEFYVEIEDVSGCVSKSSIGTANILDTITPITPVITDVSVDASGKSVISWEPCPGADFYAIYKQDEFGAWITIDSVFGVNTVSYVDNNSDASNIAELFMVRALDSCGNASASSLEHNSMNLSTVLNECAHSIQMDWNEYINWFNGTSHYRIFIEITDDNGVPLTTQEIRLGNQTEYLFQNIKHQFTYLVYIVAYNSDSSYAAVSDQILHVADLPKKPDFNYITKSTVNHNDGAIEISCYIDQTAIVDYYSIYRSEEDNNVFNKINDIAFPGNDDFIYYKDIDVETKDHFYQYRIFPIDTCGATVISGTTFEATNIGPMDTSITQSILLQSEINTSYGNFLYPGEYTNTLHFNDYIYWLGGVSHYNLYRSVNRDDFNVIPLHVFYPGDTTIYVDLVAEFVDGNGRFCYYIEAVEGGSNPHGFLERSLSNISCISQTPKLFVPNTFTPNDDDHNELFKPVTAFVSEKGYSFAIYSRSGEQIFHTNNPSKGWDGKKEGYPVQNGNYVYHVEYINGIGELTQKTDIITLVR